MFEVTHATAAAFIAKTDDRTFIFELARKGSRKIVASSFRNAVREADSLLPLRQVPLAIRAAARAHLLA